MKRTKQKAANLSSSGSKNVSTQTEHFDGLIEIAKLEEQVRVLQLENNVLRKYTENSNKSDNTVHDKPVPQTASKINVEKSSCGCKGNCSSRCGCVKKRNKCNPSCKCDYKVCQNQKLECSQENKENVNKIDVEIPKKQRTPKERNKVDTTKINKGLFSPDVRELYKDVEEGQFSDIYFSFTEKNAIINSQIDNIGNVESKNKRKEKKEKNSKEQLESMEQLQVFDPMKPRHQLSRTPPNSKNLEKSLKIENVIQSEPHFEPVQEGAIISCLQEQDIEEEKVDWEEHTAQLIPCKKCKRTFLPNRIRKHEACCKKI